jgi:hypothetical protein
MRDDRGVTVQRGAISHRRSRMFDLTPDKLALVRRLEVWGKLNLTRIEPLGTLRLG